MKFNKKSVYNFWNKESCGTGYTNAQKFSKEYFDEIELTRYNLEPMIKPFAEFENYSEKTVLEIGVGAGTDFINWVRNGAIAYGIDLTDEAIDNVQNRLSMESLSSKFLQKSDAEKLPFDDNLFDLTYSWGVIHHSPDTEKCISEIIRVTKPGGEIKLMVYNRRSITALRVWVKFCLLKGKFWKNLTYAMKHHVESYGTKAYTVKEMEDIFHTHKNVKVKNISPIVTWCDKKTTSKYLLVKIFYKFLIFIGGGDKVGWFMLINAKKI